MQKSPHEENKSAKKVSVIPCLLMIIFLPFILLYLIGTLLFVPIDYIIFKRSRYHRDFGGSYSFLSGAHPDNYLYTLIKEENIPILYAKADNEYVSRGFFICKKTIILPSDALAFAEGEWRFRINDAFLTITVATTSIIQSARAALGVEAERVVFLLPERCAAKAGEGAISAASDCANIALYRKKHLSATLNEIIAKEGR